MVLPVFVEKNAELVVNLYGCLGCYAEENNAIMSGFPEKYERSEITITGDQNATFALCLCQQISVGGVG